MKNRALILVSHVVLSLVLGLTLSVFGNRVLAQNDSADFITTQQLQVETGTLDVLAYNIYMLPLKSPDRDRRGRLLPPHLTGYDVLILSEVFDNDVRQQLRNDLRGEYPHQSRILGSDQFPEQDGGVVIFSKHPIELQGQLLFGDVCHGSDCFADKGVLYVRINKAGRRYHIFGSHLDAGSSWHSARQRLRQLELIKKSIDARSIPAHEPVIIGGDLNIDRRDWSNDHYQQMLSILNASHPAQIGHPYTSDSETNGLKDRRDGRPSREYLDYVLYSNGHLQPSRSSNEVRFIKTRSPWTENLPWWNKQVHDLSDHHAVYGRFLFHFGTPPINTQLPAACQPIADNISALEAELRGLQAELAEAAPQEKPAIIAQIRQVNDQLAIKRAELEQCRQQPFSFHPACQPLANVVNALSLTESQMVEQLAARHRELGQVTQQIETKQTELTVCRQQTAGAPPAVCQPIADAINGLEAELRDLQAELAEAAPSEKPAIIAQIRQVNDQLAVKRAELEQCRRQNPDGLSVACQRIADAIAGLRIVQQQLRQQIDQKNDELRQLQQQLQARRTELEQCQRNGGWPTAVPSDGALLRRQSGEIYVIYGGAKFWIPGPADFNALGFSSSNVRTVADSELTAIPDVPRDGTLVRELNNPAIFVIFGSMKYWIPNPQRFQELGFSLSEVRVVPNGALASLPNGGTALSSDQISVVTSLSISPSLASQNQQVQATFTVQNTGGQALTVPLLLVGARDPFNNNVDFPSVANITLQPGQQYTYQQSRAFSDPGNYEAWPAVFINDTWIELAVRTTFTVQATSPGQISVVSPLGISPNPVGQGQQAQASFVVRNIGGQALTVPVLVVGARDPSGANVDFPVITDITLQPGQEYTYQQSRTFSALGNYEAWPAAYINETWVDLGPRVTFAVQGTSACLPTYGQFGPGSWPAACWRPYADSSPFNTPLPANPRLASNSSQIIARMLGDISAIDRPEHMVANSSGTGGEPTYYSQPSDPEYTLKCTMTQWGNCPIDGHRVRIPRGAQVEGNRAARETNSDDYFYEPDAHLTVVDQTTGWEYDLWQVHRASVRPEDGDELRFSWGARTRIDGDGLAAEGNATAAHFGSLAGRLRAEELVAGQINHALSIVIDCDSASYVFPARGLGRACSSIGKSNTNAPPMGTRFQLAMSPAEINALPIREWKKTILHVMARYGAFFNDTGTNGLFAIEPEGGNQYTSLGAYADKWRNFGMNNWEAYTPEGGSLEYVGKLYNTSDDPNPNFNWTANVWSRLRVIDPCVTEGTCP